MGSRRIPQSGAPGSRSLTRSRIGIVAALTPEARTLGRAVRSDGGQGGEGGHGGYGGHSGYGGSGGYGGHGGYGGSGGQDDSGHAELASLTDGSLLAVSGMGFEAAERSARALLDAGCSALLSWGLAGGLDPALSTGTVVIPACVMLDGAIEAPAGAPDLNTSPAWRAQVVHVLGGSSGRSRINAPVRAIDKLLTSRRPVARAAEKRQAFLESGAAAVDMESYAIAQVARSRGLDFIVIRVIVDAAEDEVPASLLNAADSRGRIAIARLIKRTVASPRTLARFLGLARRYAVAKRSLREAARAGAAGLGPVFSAGEKP